MRSERIMNGTWGKLWMDGHLIAECYKFQAKETYNRDKIAMCGSLKPGFKLTSIDGTGSVGLHKVDSRMLLELRETTQGRDAVFTLIGKLADPDSRGQERIAFSGVRFDDLTIMDWEAGVTGKTEHPFTFDSYEILDAVEAD